MTNDTIAVILMLCQTTVLLFCALVVVAAIMQGPKAVAAAFMEWLSTTSGRSNKQ